MKFALNAGKTRPVPTGRVFRVPDEPTVESSRPTRVWTPNQEPDTPLKCGCSIPWPITVLLGSGGKVWCETHSWQSQISKTEIARAQRLTRKALACVNPGSSSSLFTTDDNPPPF